MTIDIIRLQALATAAAVNQYDSVALNDYRTALPPATVLGLIAEIERHRQISAEGYKPDSIIQLSGLPCAAAASCRSLDKAEGEQPDLNFQLLLLAERSCSLLEDWVQHISVSGQGLNDQTKKTCELLEARSPAWSTAVLDLLAERGRHVREEGHCDVCGEGRSTQRHKRCSRIRQQRESGKWESYMANVAAKNRKQAQHLRPLW